MIESPLAYVILFFGGLAAGFVDSIAGGGGLISLPVLLGIGLPPQVALGTNKLQSSFGSLTASVYYARRGVVSIRETWMGVVSMMVGAAVGAFVVQQLDPGLLRVIIPFLLLGILAYNLLTPHVGVHDTTPKIPAVPFFVGIGLGLGFYEGFFGPGTGSFLAMALVTGRGLNLIKATGYTKVLNFAGNIASLIVFLIGGKVYWMFGFTMACGQICGARLGAAMAVKKGVRFVRPFFLTVVLVVTLRLLYDAFTTD